MAEPVQLNTPEEAAAWVVEHIADLTPAQIADIENHVCLARPSSRRGSEVLRDITVTVLYGCRILKPLERMKDLSKMADRWALAWKGSPSGKMGGVMTSGNFAWIEICEKHWTPFVLAQVERASTSSRVVYLEADALFDPPLKK